MLKKLYIGKIIYASISLKKHRNRFGKVWQIVLKISGWRTVHQWCIEEAIECLLL